MKRKMKELRTVHLAMAAMHLSGGYLCGDGARRCHARPAELATPVFYLQSLSGRRSCARTRCCYPIPTRSRQVVGLNCTTAIFSMPRASKAGWQIPAAGRAVESTGNYIYEMLSLRHCRIRVHFSEDFFVARRRRAPRASPAIAHGCRLAFHIQGSGRHYCEDV